MSYRVSSHFLLHWQICATLSLCFFVLHSIIILLAFMSILHIVEDRRELEKWWGKWDIHLAVKIQSRQVHVLFLKNRNECKSSMMKKTLKDKKKKKGMINKSHTGVWDKRTNQKCQYLSWSFPFIFIFFNCILKYYLI